MKADSRGFKIFPYLILAGALLAAIFLLPGIQSRLYALVEEVRTSVMEELTRQTGLVFRYRSLGPGLLRQIDIKDLEVYRKDGSLLAKAGLVSVQVDLFRALGPQPLEALGDISIRDWNLDLIAEKDLDFSGAMAGKDGATAQEGPLDLLAALHRSLNPGMGITLSSGQARFRTGSTDVSATLRLLRFSNDPSVLSLELPEFRFVYGQNGTTLLESRASLGLNYGVASRVLYGTFGIFSASNDQFSLRSQEFSWSWFSDRVVLQKTADFSSLDMNLSYYFADNILKAQVRAEQHPLRQIVTFKGALGETLRDWQDMPLDLEADLSLDLSSPELDLDYVARLSTNRDITGLGPTILQVELQGNQAKARLETLVLENSQGRVALQGDLDLGKQRYDLGMDARYSFPELPWPLTAQGRLSGNFGGARFSGSAALGAMELSGLDLALDIPASVLEIKGRIADGAGQDAQIRSTLDFSSGIRLEGNLSADAWQIFSAPGYLDSFPDLRRGLAQVFDSSTGLSCSLDFSLSRGLFSFVANEVTLASALEERPYVELQGSGGLQEIKLDRLALNINDISAVLALTAGRVDESWQVSLMVETQGQSMKLGGQIATDLSFIELTGDKGINFYGTRDDLGTLYGHLRFEGFPVDLMGYPGRISASMAYEVPLDTSMWSVELISASLLLQGLLPAYPDAFARLNVAGSLSASQFLLSTVQYVDTVGGLSGRASVSQPLGSQVRLVLELAGPRKQRTETGLIQQETLSAELALAGTQLSGTYRLGDIDLKRLGIGGFEGKLGIEGSLGGTASAPLLDLDFTLDKASLGGAGLEARGRLALDQETLQLKGLRAAMLEHQLLGGELLYRFSEESFTAEGRYRGPGARDDDEMKLSAMLSLKKDSVLADRVSVGGFPLGQGKKTDLVFTGTRSERGWQWLEQQGLLSLMVRNDGRILLSTKSPFPFVGNAEGQVKNGEMDFSFSRLEIPLEPIKSFLNLGYFGFTEGNARGEIRVRGPLVDPSFYGALKLTGIKAFVELSPEEIRADEAYLILEDRSITIVPAELRAGDARLTLGGTLSLHRLGLSAFSIDIDVVDPQGVAVDTSFGIMKVKGRATGTVRVWGTGSRLMVGGKLLVFSSVLSVGDPPKPKPGVKVQSPPASELFDIGVDLTMETGKNVEFIWPSVEFPLLRSFLDREQSVRITFEGLSQSIGLYGLVSLRGGEVFYLERSFYIKEAAIRFNEQQGVFNPSLDARAELRTSYNGIPYRMTLTMANTRLLSPQGTISSDPPLSSEQIAVMLSGGDPEKAGQIDLGSAIYAGADVVTRLGLGRDIENFVRNYLPVDVFSLRTGFFPALVRDAVAPVSSPLDNESYSFGKYFDNTALLLGKFFGNDVYAELLAQVRSDDSLISRENVLGLVPELEMNMEWNTPFMDILWSFAPKDANSLYLRDNKFTLMWKF